MPKVSHRMTSWLPILYIAIASAKPTQSRTIQNIGGSTFRKCNGTKRYLSSVLTQRKKVWRGSPPTPHSTIQQASQMPHHVRVSSCGRWFSMPHKEQGSREQGENSSPLHPCLFSPILLLLQFKSCLKEAEILRLINHFESA